MFLSEVWAEAHWADAHIQLPEWSDYRADFSLLNGRVYPDTIAPNGRRSTRSHPVPRRQRRPDRRRPGDPSSSTSRTSSLVNCNAGERVALRFANLGFREQAMTTAGIRMRVVGPRRRRRMRGRDGTDTSYETDTINIGPGESYDVIFAAPPTAGARGLRHLHALQPQLHTVEQPGAGRLRRPGHRDPGLPRAASPPSSTRTTGESDAMTRRPRSRHAGSGTREACAPSLLAAGALVVGPPRRPCVPARRRDGRRAAARRHRLHARVGRSARTARSST